MLWKIQKCTTQPKHWSFVIAHVAGTVQPIFAALFFMVPPKDALATRIGYRLQAACS